MSVEQIIEHTIKQVSRYFPNFRVAYSTIDLQGKMTALKSLEPPGMPVLTGLEADLNAAPDYLGDLLKGAPVIAQDIFLDTRTAPLAEAISAGNTRAVLDVPLIHSDTLVGLLCFDSPECRQWKERKQAEEALRESEEKFRTLVVTAPDGIVLTDAQGTMLELNEACAQIYGYERDEMQGKSFPKFIPDPKSQAEAKQMFRALHEVGHIPAQEITITTKEGKRVPVELAVTALKDDDGQIINLIAIIRDITERKRAEEAIRQRTAQLEALREVGLEITAQLDLDTLLHSIVSQAKELLGGSGSGLCLYRPARDVLEVVTILGNTPIMVGRTFQQGEGLSGKVWETGKPVIVDDYGHWEGRAAAWEGHPPIAVLGVPIRWGEEFLGVLLVRSPSPRIFSPADAEVLSMLATQAAIAIENARLYTQTQQDAETKATLLHEVNHRVKNNLAAIIGLLYVEKRHVKEEDLATHQTILDDMINRIQGLATVHSLLSASEWSSLRLSEVANQVIHSALQFLPPDKDIAVTVAPAAVRVIPAQASSLALVINELATNTVKYALPALSEPHPLRITVHIAREDDFVLLEFRDNGPGYPEEVLRLEHYNVGVYLIQNIVQEQLHGGLTFHNDQGAVTAIRFKAVE
jgi:PAS domain S-box-containing protein